MVRFGGSFGLVVFTGGIAIQVLWRGSASTTAIGNAATLAGAGLLTLRMGYVAATSDRRSHRFLARMGIAAMFAAVGFVGIGLLLSHPVTIAAR